MESNEKILEKAYAEQLGRLYQTLNSGIVAAEGDTQEMDAAQRRFERGLAHAVEALRRAKEVVSKS